MRPGDDRETTFEEEPYDWEFHLRYEDNAFFVRALEDDVKQAKELVTATPTSGFARRTLARL